MYVLYIFFVCIYICMYVLYVCMYVCIVCMCTHTHTHTHTIFQKNVIGIHSIIISAEQNIHNYFGWIPSVLSDCLQSIKTYLDTQIKLHTQC
jgi:hypothetical protein